MDVAITTKLLITGEKAEKPPSRSGAKIEISFPQETLDAFRKAAEVSEQPLEEVVIFYLETKKASQAREEGLEVEGRRRTQIALGLMSAGIELGSS